MNEHLAATDPSNVDWQHGLALSWAKLASVHLKLGNVADAPIELRKGREVMALLVSISPDNARWKKDLAWFDGQIARLEGPTQEAGRN